MAPTEFTLSLGWLPRYVSSSMVSFNRADLAQAVKVGPRVSGSGPEHVCVRNWRAYYWYDAWSERWWVGPSVSESGTGERVWLVQWG